MSQKQTREKQIAPEESGRTMVEMLGTLAIIGVLSVGGVSGYGRAITAYRANAVVDNAQKQAVNTSTELSQGHDVDPDSSQTLRTPTGYEVTPINSDGGDSDITKGSNYFGIEVGGGSGKALPKEVARNLLEKALDNWKYVWGFGVKTGSSGSGSFTFTKTLAGFDEATTNAETVIIILIYKADLTPRADGAELLDTFGAVSGGDDDTCTAGIVKIRGCDGSLTDCCPDTETCEQPTNCECTSNDDCPGDQICDRDNCKRVDPDDEFSPLICYCSCGNAYYGDFVGKNGICCHGGYQNGQPAFASCGCPFVNPDDPSEGTGTLASDGQTCCNGVYDQRTNALNPPACGCPSTVELECDDDWTTREVVISADHQVCCLKGLGKATDGCSSVEDSRCEGI